MTTRVVEHGEERFVFDRSFLPVSLSVGLVPDTFRSLKLIVLLRIVRAVVTGFPQVRRKRFDMRRQLRAASHVMSAQRSLIHARDDRRAARSTNSRCHKRIRVPSPLLRQPIEIRSPRVGIPVAVQVSTDVFAREPKYVWAIVSDNYRLHDNRQGKGQ